MSEIEHQVIRILASISEKPVTEVTPDKQVMGDLEIDSAQVLELLTQLEDTLDIEISDEDAARMQTVADILSFVMSRSDGAPV